MQFMEQQRYMAEGKLGCTAFKFKFLSFSKPWTTKKKRKLSKIDMLVHVSKKTDQSKSKVRLPA